MLDDWLAPGWATLLAREVAEVASAYWPGEA